MKHALKELLDENIDQYGKAAWDLFFMIGNERTRATGRALENWFTLFKRFLKITWKVHIHVKKWESPYIKSILGMEENVINALMNIHFFKSREFDKNKEILKKVILDRVIYWREIIYDSKLVENDEILKYQLQAQTFLDSTMNVSYLQSEKYKIFYEYFKNKVDYYDLIVPYFYQPEVLKFVPFPYPRRLFIRVGLGYWTTWVSGSQYFNLEFIFMPSKCFPQWIHDPPDDMVRDLNKLKLNKKSLGFSFPEDVLNVNNIPHDKLERVIRSQIGKICKCGYLNNSLAKFCNNCGNLL